MIILICNYTFSSLIFDDLDIELEILLDATEIEKKIIWKRALDNGWYQSLEGKYNDGNMNCNRKKLMYASKIWKQHSFIRIENLPHLQQGMTHNEAMNLGCFELLKHCSYQYTLTSIALGNNTIDHGRSKPWRRRIGAF